MKDTVYFAEILGRDVVKVGFTRNLPKRLLDLRYWMELPRHSPYENAYFPDVQLLASFAGNLELESALHFHFGEHLVYGNEGFAAEPIKAALGTLTEAQFPAILDEHRRWKAGR